MESYFYCSYENSKTGFFHTRLEGDALVPVEGGHEGLPAALGEFFSYGIFRLLWRDLAEPVDLADQEAERAVEQKLMTRMCRWPRVFSRIWRDTGPKTTRSTRWNWDCSRGPLRPPSAPTWL